LESVLIYPNSDRQAVISMSATKPGLQRRVMVTGSRGKSSVVRLLHTAMQATGLQTYARITGVVPRELGADGIRVITRSGAAHVEEMRWWLRHIPSSVQGIVMENSAISPDLQSLAGRWLRPHVTVLTNTVADHQEAWGPTRASAAETLVRGIPDRGLVVIPADLETDAHLLELLDRRRCKVIFAESVSAAGAVYRATNLGLALGVVEKLGLEKDRSLRAMLRLSPDQYDFQLARCGGAEVAMAFSINDIASTMAMFRSLKWSAGETRVVYNHRADRPGRFRSFLGWLNQPGWREVLIIGDKPRMRLGSARYVNIKNVEGLLRLFRPGERIFGCGNIRGVPLSLTAVLEP